jgi:hypothetical protein
MADKSTLSGDKSRADTPFEKRIPSGSWTGISLAALPFLLILLADGLPKLLVEAGLLTWEGGGMRILIGGQIILLAACFLAIFILAWRGRWPAWSATWYPFFCAAPILLVIGLSEMLVRGQPNFTIRQTISQNVVMYILIPLIIAVLLYAVTRLDPLRGLLAALPVLYLLWNINMEFVPDSIELAIKVPSVALICLTIAFVLSRGDWRPGLYAVLGMNLGVGALFAYGGIYHGGTLPFVAPGPNLVEVARSLIPQYLATSAILLGPLFAWKFRQAGRSGSLGAKIAYNMALAGLLLVIMANLAGLMETLQASSASVASMAGSSLEPLIGVGIGAYLVSVLWLYRSEPIPRTVFAWVERGLMSLLPLAIPLALVLPFISARWPVSNLYGVPLLWVLPHAVSLSLGLVWLGLSAWVVTREGKSSTQGAGGSFSHR